MVLLTGRAWMGLTEFTGFVSSFFAIPINCLLLYCILTKSGKAFGRYKHLMAWFAIQSIFFTVIATLTHMCFHTIGGTFMMFTLSNRLHLPSWGIWVLLGICCVSVGYVLLILSAQFIYRYFAMIKVEKLKYFSGWYRLYFLAAMILVAGVYGSCGFVGIDLTPEKDFQIRETMARSYNVTPEKIHYVAVEYFVRNKKGETDLNYFSICTAIMLNSVFSVMVVIIIYCGLKTYRMAYAKTCHLSNHMSLHRQLFTALMIQTLTPTLLIFIPCIIFYILPIFEIPLGIDANILSISLMLYPMIDPIGVLFCIKNYRIYMQQLFLRRIIKRARCSAIELKTSRFASVALKYSAEESAEIESPRFNSIQN